MMLGRLNGSVWVCVTGLDGGQVWFSWAPEPSCSSVAHGYMKKRLMKILGHLIEQHNPVANTN